MSNISQPAKVITAKDDEPHRTAVGWDSAFVEAYEKFRALFPSASKLTEQDLGAICTDIRNVEHKFSAGLFSVAASCSICTFIICAYLAAIWISHAKTIYVSLWSWSTSSQYLIARQIACVSILAIAFYGFLPFIASTIPKVSWAPKSHEQTVLLLGMARKTPPAKWFAVVSGYLLYLPLVYQLLIYFPMKHWIGPLFLGIWFAFPTLSLVMLGSTMLVIALVGERLGRLERPASFYKSITRLLRLLLKLHGVNGASLTIATREKFIREIQKIADLLEDAYDPQVGLLGEWASERLSILALRFRQLGSWLYFPQNESVRELEKKLLSIANVMLTGEIHYLDDLLHQDIEYTMTDDKSSKWKKIWMHALMALYFALPLFAFVLAAKHWGFHIEGISQTVAALLYLLWVIIGFFAFSESISPESRALLTDVIKSIVGRKV